MEWSCFSSSVGITSYLYVLAVGTRVVSSNLLRVKRKLKFNLRLMKHTIMLTADIGGVLLGVHCPIYWCSYRKLQQVHMGNIQYYRFLIYNITVFGDGVKVKGSNLLNENNFVSG